MFHCFATLFTLTNIYSVTTDANEWLWLDCVRMLSEFSKCIAFITIAALILGFYFLQTSRPKKKLHIHLYLLHYDLEHILNKFFVRLFHGAWCFGMSMWLSKPKIYAIHTQVGMYAIFIVVRHTNIPLVQCTSTYGFNVETLHKVWETSIVFYGSD